MAVLLLGMTLGGVASWWAATSWHPFGVGVAGENEPISSTPTTGTGDPAPVSGTYLTAWSEGDVELRYHYDDHDLTREELRGLVVFFDGDGTRSFESPDEGRAQRLAVAAAEEDRAFAFLDAPTGTSWTAGDTEQHADAVRELVLSLAEGRSVLLMGYSGGAEFLAGSVVREGSGWLPEDSGVLLVGGGGTYSRPVEPPDDPAPSITWVVGDDDGYGATEPEDWSALEASEVAVAAYREAGYGSAERIVVEGGHTDYDFVALLRSHASSLAR